MKGQGQLRQGARYLPQRYRRPSPACSRSTGRTNDKRKAKLASTDDSVQRLHALDKNLNRFYVGIDADYFVHKDLGGFLRRESERYVKDVVLSGVEGLLAEERDETAVLVARAFYRVPERIIAFLAATEEFQKNLFLLKKKVVRTDWLISVGKLAEWFEDDAERNEVLLPQVHGSDALKRRSLVLRRSGIEVAEPQPATSGVAYAPHQHALYLKDGLTAQASGGVP